MTFSTFLCTVCERFVHGFVQSLFECASLIFQALRHFVHGVHSIARTYACERVRVCAHTHTCAHMRMHKPCTPCTHSYFSFKNKSVEDYPIVNKYVIKSVGGE